MQMKEQTVIAPAACAALAFVVIFVISLASVPLAIGKVIPNPFPVSSGSDYPIELIRAHTIYKTVDPATPVVIGLGIKGNR